MIDDNIHIELIIEGQRVDVSYLLKPSSLTLTEPAFNDDRRSTMGTASWTLIYDADLFARIVETVSPVMVTIRHGEFGDLVFDGRMDPVANTGWTEPDRCDPLSCEAVDFSVGLDKRIAQSVSFPAVVDGPSFYIYKKDAPDMSILYRLLELAGLSDRIAKDAPDIPQLVRHFAATQGDKTYRDLIDGLLADYLYCLTVRDCQLTWVPTALKKIGHVQRIGTEDILAADRTTISRRYDAHDGVTVTWPRTKVYDDALLWRGNLPVGDTSDPTPGEAIAGGDYWPEDSDIIETWQDFGTEFLDSDYLSGKNRLRNNDIGLIASSDQYVKDTKDEAIALDPVDADHTVVYEALRARLRYKNTGESAAKLYWSEIYGKALVRTQKVVATYPEAAADPEEYACGHIYDKDSADRLVQGRYMLLTVGCFYLEFTSRSDLVPGVFYYLEQGRVEGHVQVKSRSRTYDGSGRYKYQVVRTEPFSEVKVGSTAHQGSGAQRPGQDGSTPRLIYIRSYSLPDTPVGDDPPGWTLSLPDGDKPLWWSCGTFSSTGNLVGRWSVPQRMSGIDRGKYRGAVSSFPSDPADGDSCLYTGPSANGLLQYHFYKYSAVDDLWTETKDSDIVMGGMYDALQIAKQADTLIYAALIVVELLVARKLMVGGGSLASGLLVRMLDDDGTGKAMIEARYNGDRLWWIDPDTGRMFGNFAQILQYLPYNFADSLDSSHPMECEFFVPENANVEAIALSVKGVKYRAYSSSAGVTDTWGTETSLQSPQWIGQQFSLSVDNETAYTDEVSGHTHGYSDSVLSGGAWGDGAHGHNLATDWNGNVTGVESGGTHVHSMTPSSKDTSSAGGHRHSYSKTKVNQSGTLDHTHKINLSHSHAITFGIYEGMLPTNIRYSIAGPDGTYSSPTSISSGQKINLDSTTIKPGWNSIKLTSDTMGRLFVHVIVKARIDTSIQS